MIAHHETNRHFWDAISADWAKGTDRQGVWRRCAKEPRLVLDERELHWLGDVAGKTVAVLGSGDNLVVLALAGLGARVTSVDISENQLAVARQRAGELGLSVEFLRADVTNLSALPAGRFDTIYTGGHVAVWVSDLKTFYAEAVRILKPGGRLIVSEYHPFRRVWKAEKDRLELANDYFERGPFVYESAAGKQNEFQWTVGDYITTVMEAGCELLTVEEFGSGSDGGWEVPPVTGLPRILLVVGRKR